MVRALLGGMVVALMTIPVLAGDDPKPGAIDQKAMMEAWAKHGTPGAGHKRLEPLVGRWTYTGQMWMDPSQPPTEIKGTSESKWVLGGRFLESHIYGEFFGQPFHGIATLAYDNTTQHYVQTWIDSMTTSITVSSGEADAAGTTLALSGEETCPLSKAKFKSRMVTRVVSPDAHESEFYKTEPGGKETKMMVLKFTRVKGEK
jgi:hypothetical protein